jgi:hypothetical protein
VLATGRDYVEGYAILSDGVPTYHAWTVDKHGIVFDDVLGTEVAVGGYFGLPIKRSVLTQGVIEKRRHGSPPYASYWATSYRDR